MTPAVRTPATPLPTARGFVIRFLLAALAGLALVAWSPPLTAAAIAHTVRHMAAVARWFGLPAQIQGSAVAWRGLSLEIVPECTPLVPLVLLVSAIAAYPATLRHRLAGIAIAVPVMWIYNLIRVLALAVVLDRRPAWFEFVHVYLWQAVTLAACAGLFALWLRLAPGPAPRTGHS